MSLTVRKFDRDSVAPPKTSLELPSTFLDGSPLDIEIGCGVGWHPIRYAGQNPERRLIAIEHTREKFLSFERRAINHGFKNLHPVHADAIRYITHALAAESIERVLILYPNPEPQAANKRWFRMPFFSELLSKLKTGGHIQLATNIESYAQEAKTYAQDAWDLTLVQETLITESKAPRTHFEKKYLARGETCFDLTFAKP